MTSSSKPRSSSKYADNAVLNELCNLACDNLESYLDYFSLDLRRYGKRYVGRCPVHGGSSSGGVNLYPEGYAARGKWECHSNKCEKSFSRSLIGLTRGVMSHDAYGWSREGDRTVPTRTAVDEICKFLGVALDDLGRWIDARSSGRPKSSRPRAVPSRNSAPKRCSRGGTRSPRPII